MDKIYNYINGDFLTAHEGKWLNNYNPALGVIYGYIPDSDLKDVALAEKAASNAFSSWSNTSIKNVVMYYIRLHHLSLRDWMNLR